MTSPRDWLRDRPAWEHAELIQAARDFEAGRAIEQPLFIDDWHIVLGGEVTHICGILHDREEQVLTTEVVVGVLTDRGLIRVGFGWLKLGQQADPAGDLRSHLERLEAEAKVLRDALLGRY